MSTRKVISRRCCGFWEPELLAALAGLAILLGMIMPMARKANQPGWLGFLASVGIWAFGLRVFVGVDRMIGQADKSWLRLSKRLVRQLPWLGCLVPASWLLTAAIFQGPALITQRRLPELRFTKSDLGWSAKLPRTGPQLFGQNLTVEVQTRLFPDSPWILPPVSQRQADLLHRILPALPALTKRAESALIDHGGVAQTFGQSLRRPRVCLDPIRDDGSHWSIIVEQTDQRDGGHHVEFYDLELQEVWVGSRATQTIP